ncbi:hypothetical protein CANARDRAFT_27944 [[Candida] arabinofermentans NRRL YB-2248]|uniref:3'-5' exonuclease domain-containing protein n=1 Tax=[Candida] arabinofermentans NRRL YB-2248 TaxID=983967 RepID=A0A1E4T289_9ASCO|nr:hypothetical protein CANARDRAFT_27944 [[Candida] arabinofermentans NRRL YB-2248]
MSNDNKNTDPSDLEQLAPSLVNLIRLSTAINAKDINFFKSVDSDIKSKTQDVNKQLIQLMDELVQSSLTILPDVDMDENKLSVDDENGNWKIIGNVLDTLFENTEISLDQYSKYKKTATTDNNSSSVTSEFTYLDENDQGNSVNNQKRSIPQSTNIEKPQLKFNDPINNFETTPFKPLITTKPNALKPFEESMKLIPATDSIPEHYENPYSYEIMNQEYPEWILEPSDENYESIPWKESEEPIWIDDSSQLDELLLDLSKCKVIGIDLEHHDFRTYHGLTSLMQITSDHSKKDYLIDPLSPKLRSNLSVLNIVFTDPNIIKVFHGAYMDIIWLQRDLGLYIVSLFDTYHAARELSLGKYSLAFLLEKYVKFKTSKKWQLADWRLRPLNNEMRNYAKADTHFLIEIFHKLHNELLSNKPESLKTVLYESRKVSNRRFEYSTYRPKNLKSQSSSFNSQQGNVISTNNSIPQTPEFKESGKFLSLTDNFDRDLPWSNLISANGILLPQRPLLEVLFKWRDELARKLDESTRYVMSDFMLISLVTSFDSSSISDGSITEGKVLEIINSTSRYSGGSLLIRKYVSELTKLIKDTMVELNNLDDEIWDKVSGIESNRNNAQQQINDGDDVYKLVTDVEELERNFTNISKDFQNNNFSTSEDTTVGSVIEKIETVSLPEQIWSVGYPKKGGVNYINLNTVKQRLTTLIDHLTEESNVEYELPENEEEEEEEEAQVETVDEPVESSAEETKKEDPNEIITLRKHQKQQHQKRFKEDNTFLQDEIKLDLSSKRVLEQPATSREDKKARMQKKRKTFDPYVEVDDIPKLKRKKPIDMSKNVVFKKKK